MPLLGLFSRKKKAKDETSSLSSPTTERSFKRSRLQIFGNNISTRSLPPQLSPDSPPPPLPTPSKRPALFKWGTTKSSPPTALASPPPDPPPLPDNFNLRSFRHMSPSPTSPTPPPQRPRGTSTASNDSSQRISVAAFREAQAKRSLAGSPRPNPRLSSTMDSDSDSEEEPRRPGHRKNSSMDHRATKSELGHGPKYTLGNRSTGALPQANNNDDDDAPLASLVHRKPLVDISSLTAPKAKSTDNAFTQGATLLSSKTPPKHFVSPPHSPAPQAPKHSASLDVITAPQAGLRMSPMRKDSSPAPRENRENLADRLNRISKASSSSLAVDSTTKNAPAVVANMNPHAPARFNSSNRTSMSLPPPAFSVDENFADLASMLGAGVRLISRNGEETPLDSSSSESESEPEESDSDSDAKRQDRINPIPIKQRTPAPSFSVTSRPPVKRPTLDSSAPSPPTTTTTTKVSPTPNSNNPKRPSPELHAPAPRPRSATLLSAGTTTPSSSMSTPPLTSSTTSSPPSSATRQRSSTLIQNSSSSSSLFSQPARPFAQPQNRQATSSPISSESTTTSSATKPVTPGSQDSLTIPHAPYSSSNSSSGASSTKGNSGNNNNNTKRNSGLTVVKNDKRSFSYAEPSHLREGAATSGPTRSETEPKIFSGGTTGLTGPKRPAGGGHAKRASVSFDTGTSVYSSHTQKPGIRESKSRETIDKAQQERQQDQRRTERRRNEAKAALEMGKFFNGKGPVNLPSDDEEDDDDRLVGRMQDLSDGEDNQPITQTRAAKRSSMMSMTLPNSAPTTTTFVPSPQMTFPMTSPTFGMPVMATPQMGTNPMYMLAAHNQAMVIAKQAYQMAAAQQAMAVAGEEWERGSNIGFTSPTGSLSPPGSFSPIGMGWPTGMPMNMGGLGMFPAGSRSSVSLSMFGGAQSEYGGPVSGPSHPLTAGALNSFNGPNGGGSPGWGSKSVYGETFGRDRASKSFGPTSPPGGGRRESGYFPPQPSQPSKPNGAGRGAVDSQARNRTVSQPANMHHRPPLQPGARRGGAPPPSSWKASNGQ